MDRSLTRRLDGWWMYIGETSPLFAKRSDKGRYVRSGAGERSPVAGYIPAHAIGSDVSSMQPVALSIHARNWALEIPLSNRSGVNRIHAGATIEAVYFLETGEWIDVGNYNGRGFAFRHMVKQLEILWEIEPSRE